MIAVRVCAEQGAITINSMLLPLATPMDLALPPHGRWQIEGGDGDWRLLVCHEGGIDDAALQVALLSGGAVIEQYALTPKARSRYGYSVVLAGEHGDIGEISQAGAVLSEAPTGGAPADP